MSKKVIEDFFVTIQNPDNIDHLDTICSPDFTITMDTGEQRSSLATYKNMLQQVYAVYPTFTRDIKDVVSEPTDNGTKVVVYTTNTKTNQNGEVETFNDFTQFLVNTNGKIQAMLQGPGMYWHLVKDNVQ